MRVLLLASVNSIHTVRWANALCAQGVEIHVACCCGHNALVARLNPVIPVHELPVASPMGYVANAMPLRSLARRIRPDVVHAHYASGYGTLLRAARLRPSVLSVWGSDVFRVPERNPIARHVVRKNLQFPTVICSTSAVMAAQARAVAEDEDLVPEVVPFGVDLSEFSPGDEDGRSGIAFGVVKSFKPIYGIDLIIRAFASASMELDGSGHGSTSLVLVGDGPQRPELEALAAELGIGEKVTFTGAVSNSDLPAILRTFDIFVQGSYTESFGVAIVEAAACGVPVIATDAPGFVEVLGGGDFGVIVPRGEVDSLSQVMVALGSDPEARKRMGAAGIANVEQRYDFHENVRDMISIYRRIVGEGA